LCWFNIVIKGTASLPKEVPVLREFVLKQPGEQWCVVVIDFEFSVSSFGSLPPDDFKDAFGSVVLKPQIDCTQCDVLECLIEMRVGFVVLDEVFVADAIE
jgi:hypothetical protein